MNSERFNHLVAIINHDLKQAEIRRDAFSRDSQEYSFEDATVLTLKCVLFDMKQLKLIK